MSGLLALIGYIAGAFGLLAVIVSGFIVARSTATKTTIASQKDLIDTLIKGKEEQKEQIADLGRKYDGASKAINNLEGQVKTLRDIPLQNIGSDLSDISKDLKSISGNQEKIARILEKNGLRDPKNSRKKANS